jgi:hypothetical protein
MTTCQQCGQPFTPFRNGQKFCTKECRWGASNGSRKPLPPSKVHLVIPDTQVEPGRPIHHLRWIFNYCADRYTGKPLTRIMLGDHWNMGSLSSYDRGKGKMEGRRVVADIDAGNLAWELGFAQNDPCWDDHFLMGNHEHRITRAADDNVQLDGLLSLDALDTGHWQRHGFLEPLELDGVTYAHYFYNPNTGRPYGGENAETRLKQIGTSFTMGHQQGLKTGMRYVAGRQQRALIAGSCYLHDEDYLGPQGNAQWRGIVICHNVDHGAYDIMEVGLDWLCQRYEGMTLADFSERYKT